MTRPRANWSDRPAVPRPKQRTSELRDQVLRVALDLLSRDGVAGFTARAVAQSAATSVPAVYELFGDKAGLVQEAGLLLERPPQHPGLTLGLRPALRLDRLPHAGHHLGRIARVPTGRRDELAVPGTSRQALGRRERVLGPEQ